VSTGYEAGAELKSTPTISICYCLSCAPVPVDRADILVVPLWFYNLRLSIVNLFIVSQLSVSTSTMSTTATTLYECNYRQWAKEAKALLRAQGLWKNSSGEMRVPSPPIVATSGTSTTRTTREPRDTDYDFLPESTDTAYLNLFYHFLREWERWQMNNDKACGQLTSLMESTIQIRYQELTEQKQLWDPIKADFENVIKLDGLCEMAKLTSCQLESYPSVTEWISAQFKIISDLAICDITIEDSWREFYIVTYIPNTEEWRTSASILELTEKADTVASIITDLLSFEARLRRHQGLAPHASLFITKKV